MIKIYSFQLFVNNKDFHYIKKRKLKNKVKTYYHLDLWKDSKVCQACTNNTRVTLNDS
jgi:hypothetical protein